VRKKQIFVMVIMLLVELCAMPKGRTQQVQPYACSPDAPKGYTTLKLNVQTKSVLGPLQYKNDDHVWIVVEDINPFVATYTLKVKRQPVSESAITTFLSALGGIDAGIVPQQKSPTQTQPTPASTPAPSPTPARGVRPAIPAAPACDQTPLNQLVDKFNALDAEEKKVNKALNAVSTKYKADSVTFSGLFDRVKKEHLCLGIQASAVALRQFLAGVQSPDQIKASEFGQFPVESDPIKVLKENVDQLARDAKAQRRAILDYRKVTSGKVECASLLDNNAKLLDDEDTFIDGLIGPTTGTPEVQALTDQLNQLKTTFGQWSDAHSAVEKLFDPASSGNPFVLTYPLTDSQSDDEVILVAGPPVLSVPGSAGNSKAGASSGKPAATDPAAFDVTVHFGFGARFSLSGGLVVSFLENRQFTTANGQVAYQNNSQTRILPMAQLNSRFYDCDTTNYKCLLAPQISVGITAKADDKGTAPEYLIGPSWAFVKRQLFITLGAYAGQQQRLLGGLQVGQATSLSAANLPIAKEYHWSGAIAVSWKIK
jgi:hypothetical protein